MALQAGTMSVTLEYAKDLADHDFFGRQDPYAILHVGTQKIRSRTHEDGGRNPVWNETFNFQVINENDMLIRLYDADTMKRDDPIGEARVYFTKAREQGQDHQQAAIITANGRQKGFVALRLMWNPSGGYRAQPYGYPQLQPAYPQYPATTPVYNPYPVAGSSGYPAQATAAPSYFPAAYPGATPAGYPPAAVPAYPGAAPGHPGAPAPYPSATTAPYPNATAAPYPGTTAAPYPGAVPPPYGGTYSVPPYGTPASAPYYGATPSAPPYGAAPSAPPYGAAPGAYPAFRSAA